MVANETVGCVRDAYSPDFQLAAVVLCIVPSAEAGRLYSDAMWLLHDTYPTW